MRLISKRLSRLGIIVLPCIFLFVAAHEGRANTSWGYYYTQCKQSNMVISWARGIVTACGSTPEESLKLCVKSVRRLAPKEWHSKLGCKVAYNGKSIIDPVYSQMINKIPTIPVAIKIFDRPSGKLQEVKGTFESYAFDGKSQTEMFRLRSKGATICDGGYRIGMFGARFTVKCFGETFKGSTATRHIRKIGNYFALVPKSVKVTSQGSYIEVVF